MNLRFRKACAIVSVLCMAAAGCAGLGSAAVDTILNDLTTVDDGTVDDGTVDETNGGDANDNSEDPGNSNDNSVPADDNANDNVDDNDNGATPGDDDTPANGRDLSGFTQFAFSRSPGLGFCPPLDEVYAASIVVGADGAQTLNLSVLREGVAGLDPCVGSFVVPCATAAQLQERILTNAEVSAVAAVFSSVSVEEEPDPMCLEVAFDPCVINQFAWGSFLITDFKCGFPRLPPGQADEIISLFEQLRNAQ